MIPEAVSQPFGKRPVHKHPLSVALLGSLIVLVARLSGRNSINGSEASAKRLPSARTVEPYAAVT